MGNQSTTPRLNSPCSALAGHSPLSKIIFCVFDIPKGFSAFGKGFSAFGYLIRLVDSKGFSFFLQGNFCFWQGISLLLARDFPVFRKGFCEILARDFPAIGKGFSCFSQGILLLLARDFRTFFARDFRTFSQGILEFWQGILQFSHPELGFMGLIGWEQKLDRC